MSFSLYDCRIHGPPPGSAPLSGLQGPVPLAPSPPGHAARSQASAAVCPAHHLEGQVGLGLRPLSMPMPPTANASLWPWPCHPLPSPHEAMLLEVGSTPRC